MKNSLRLLTLLCLVMGLLLVTTTKGLAVDQKYDSNGQTSFFGKYEYDAEEQDSNKSHPNNINPSNNYSEDGQVILPRTGDDLNPIYSATGIILLIGISGLIMLVKRNEEGKL